MRLNRFFTDRGICSRREADRLIEQGRVLLNGKVAKLGDKFCETDVVSLDGQIVSRENLQKKVIIAYHKPPGIECTSDPEKPNNIIEAVGYPDRIFHIGRLDKNSEGLILLTNRGEIVNQILRSEGEKEKEYFVQTEHSLSDAEIKKLREGVDIGDGRGLTKKCVIEKIDALTLKFVLTEGRFHQIRKMIKVAGHKVKKLKRVRVMMIHLGNLKRGQYRLLTESEQTQLLSELDSCK
jgi:23S rRNA pseudouridine2604 synthase